MGGIVRHTLRELLTELAQDCEIENGSDVASVIEELLDKPLVFAARSGEIPLLSVYENNGTVTFDVGEE